MKTSRIIILILILPLFAAQVSAEMHEFKLPDGRALEAEIIDYNARLGLVELKRTDGKRVKVKPSIFVQDDQAYIEKWNALNGFSSESLLKISCDEKRGERRKEKEVKEVPYVGGGSEMIQLNETTFEKIAYEIHLQNMNTSSLNDLRAVYIIYYEQSMLSKNDKPKVEQKSHKATLAIPPIGSREEVLLTTEEVEIHNDNVNSIRWSDGSVYIGGDGDVHGIRVRVYMKAASGKEVMREVHYPHSLSEEKFPWKD